MALEPINEVIIHVKRSSLIHSDCPVALHAGCSLIKIIYAAKNETDGDLYQLNCALFENRDLGKALEWLRLHAQLPSNGKICVSGVCGDSNRGLIKEKLGLMVEYIDEVVAQNSGLLFLLNNVSEEELYFPQPDVSIQYLDKIKNSGVMGKMMDNMNSRKAQDKAMNQSEKWPALIVIYGSSGSTLMIDKDQNTTMIQPPYHPGGRTMMGLAKLLLGTSNYDEVMSLADRGDRRNVDLQVFEVLKDDENSPYGKFPADMPILAFGKPSDYDKNLEEFRKEDVAASLLSLMVTGILSNVAMAIRQTNIHRVYFAGNFFRGEVIRNELERMCKALNFRMKTNDIKFLYLKTGHLAAMGALISSNSDNTQS